MDEQRNLYMEHFPYIDSIRFGEGFNYNEPPDYRLIEISGIPYGLTGYWAPSCPVRADNKDVLVTVYAKADMVLLSVASWAPEPVSCRLKIDFNALGISREGARLAAPFIKGFQDSATFAVTDQIHVEPGKGWLLILSPSSATSQKNP